MNVIFCDVFSFVNCNIFFLLFLWCFLCSICNKERHFYVNVWRLKLKNLLKSNSLVTPFFMLIFSYSTFPHYVLKPFCENKNEKMMEQNLPKCTFYERNTKYMCIKCSITLCNICAVSASPTKEGYSEENKTVGLCKKCNDSD